MKNIILIIISFICVACSNSLRQEYFYENGNIKERRLYPDKKDTTTYSITKYYLNGQMSEKGFLKNREKDSIWEYWYSDGDIRWVGTFTKGAYKNPIDTIIIISFSKDTLYAGEKVYARMRYNYCQIEDFIVACSNCFIQYLDNKDLYDFMIIPKNKGITNFYFSNRRYPKIKIQQTFMIY